MATRSLIGIVNKDGSIETIYNHWDGYPTYVGTVLTLFYGEKETRKLLKFGNRSSLHAKPTKVDTYQARGESGQESVKYASFAEFAKTDKSGAEFVYLLESNEKQGYAGSSWVAYKVNWENESLQRLGIIERGVSYKETLAA
jgi:hypothetical protein